MSQPKKQLLRTVEDVSGLSVGQIEVMLPNWHQGFDKQGRPVMIQQSGRVVVPKLLKYTDMEHIKVWHTSNNEHAARLCGEQTQKLGRLIDQWVIIVDAEGWAASNLFNSNVFRWAAHMADVDQNHHPERLFRMYIINAPSVVFRFYSLISNFIAEETRQKIQLFVKPEDWKPVLANDIDLSELPPEYGGTGVNNIRQGIAEVCRPWT